MHSASRGKNEWPDGTSGKYRTMTERSNCRGRNAGTENEGPISIMKSRSEKPTCHRWIELAFEQQWAYTIDVIVRRRTVSVNEQRRLSVLTVILLRATAYMLSAHMLSQFRLSVCLSVRLSVCLSVTRVDQSKTVEVRIMQFSPYSSPIPLVLQDKFHPEILTGLPWAGASNKDGVGKQAIF